MEATRFVHRLFPAGSGETMYKDHTIGVVITAYNEEGFVGDVIEGLPPLVDRVYVVDDGSTDGTWNEISRAAERVNSRVRDDSPVTQNGIELDPRVVPIRRDRNGGVGAGKKTGYVRALRDGIDVTVTMDGDGQMKPRSMTRLIDPIVDERADYSKGNRLWYEETRESMSRWRLFGNSLLTMLTRFSSGYWRMSDPQNGYTAISRSALQAIPLEQLTDDYGFLNDMLTLLNIYEFRIADVQHRAEYADEESHINYSSFVPRLSGLLAKNFVDRLKARYLVFDFHPLVSCYLLGVGTIGVSLAVGLYAIAGLSAGTNAFLRGSVALLTFLVGSLFLVLGITFDINQSDQGVVQVHHLDRPERIGEIPPSHPARTEEASSAGPSQEFVGPSAVSPRVGEASVEASPEGD